LLLDLAILEDRHLGERSMNIHADDTHAPSLVRSREPAGLARHLRIRARSATGQVVGAAM
jgi:hypothetical protein